MKKIIICILISILTWQSAFAQNGRNGSGQSSSATKAIAAVEANPEDAKAHQLYQKSVGYQDSVMQLQYAKWMKRFPKSPMVPFMIGKTFSREERPEAKEYLLQTVELAPDWAEAWALLAGDASRMGDTERFRQYQDKAMSSDPKNAGYAFSYAYSFRNEDQQKFDSLALDVALRFRDTEEEAKAYVWLAETTKNEKLKAIYYKELEKIFFQKQSGWARSGMIDYFDFLINSEPEEAYGLALNMSKALKTRTLEWRHKMDVAKRFIDARELLDRKEPEAALKVLQNIRLNDRFFDSFIDADEKLRFLKAESLDAALQTQSAYDSLLVYYSNRPAKKYFEALKVYGAKLGKDSTTIKKEISTLRNASSQTPEPFSLVNYLTNQDVTLNQLKGKVVLITFWFPGCGPCHEEFPYFESVVRKFSTSELAYLGINGVLSQGEYVVPMLKASGYSFIPLKEDPSRKMGVLTTRSFPRNFLLDQKGRVIFSDFRIDGKNEEMLERMIRELIEADKS